MLKRKEIIDYIVANVDGFTSEELWSQVEGKRGKYKYSKKELKNFYDHLKENETKDIDEVKIEALIEENKELSKEVEKWKKFYDEEHGKINSIVDSIVNILEK